MCELVYIVFPIFQLYIPHLILRYIMHSQKRKTVELPILFCNRCGHMWVPRTVSPMVCPACLSKKWNDAPLDNHRAVRNRARRRVTAPTSTPTPGPLTNSVDGGTQDVG